MMSLRQRLFTVALVLLFIVLTYMGTQKIVINYLGALKVDLLLPGEDKIPFLPLSILIYILEYVLPISLFLIIVRKKRIIKIVAAYICLVVIHAFFYILFPIEYVLRPDLDINMLGSELVLFLYQLDAPINTFPSMHVSLAFLTYFIVRYYRPDWTRFFLVLAVLISASTLFVKQHYIADVVSGIALGWFVYYLVFVRKTSWLEKVSS